MSRWFSIPLYLQALPFLTYPAKSGTGNAATFNHPSQHSRHPRRQPPQHTLSATSSLNICPPVVNPPSFDALHIFALGLSPISADPNPSYQSLESHSSRHGAVNTIQCLGRLYSHEIQKSVEPLPALVANQIASTLK